MVANSSAAAFPPLCVDLDETLVKTDLLHETLLSLVKRAPLSLLAIPFWLMKGRAHLKHQLALCAQIEVAHLPYRNDLIDFLRSEQSRGRHLVLVTAADRLLATRVQQHLHLFNEVVASDGTLNLKGANKARHLEEKFGVVGPATIRLRRRFACRFCGLANRPPGGGRIGRQALHWRNKLDRSSGGCIPESDRTISAIAEGMPAAPMGKKCANFCSDSHFASNYRCTGSSSGRAGLFQFQFPCL